MKALTAEGHIQDLNLEVGEKVLVYNRVWVYEGVEQEGGKTYDVLAPAE